MPENTFIEIKSDDWKICDHIFSPIVFFSGLFVCTRCGTMRLIVANNSSFVYRPVGILEETNI